MKRLLTLLSVLVLALPAKAVINAGGDQLSPPQDDPGFNNVGTAFPLQPGQDHTGKNVTCGGTGPGGVYMGNGWVLTGPIGHVGVCNMQFNGRMYNWDGVSFVQPIDSRGDTLSLFKLLPPWPDQQDPTIHPLITIISQTPAPGTVVTLIGNGPGKGASISEPDPLGDCGGSCQGWKEVGEPLTHKTWGHARVFAGYTGGGVLIPTFFEPFPVTDTAQAGIGDSGGAMFVKAANGVWMLAGIMQSIAGGCNYLDPATHKPVATQGCDQTQGWDLSLFRSQIVPYLPVDTDPPKR